MKKELQKKIHSRMLIGWGERALYMVGIVIVVSLAASFGMLSIDSGFAIEISRFWKVATLYSLIGSVILSVLYIGTSMPIYLWLDVAFGASRAESVRGILWYCFVYILLVVPCGLVFMKLGGVPIFPVAGMYVGILLISTALGQIGLWVRLCYYLKAVSWYMAGVMMMFAAGFITYIIASSIASEDGRKLIERLFDIPDKAGWIFLLVGILLWIPGYILMKKGVMQYAVEQ